MSYPFDVDEKTPYGLVLDWILRFKREVDKDFNKDDIALCGNLIWEEHDEVQWEIDPDGNTPDEIKLTKELCDLIWVCYFCAAKFDLPIEKAFMRVYESNMSKLDDDGNPILREDGKILKSNNYKPADLKDLF